VFHTQSALGGSLLGQQKYAGAEPLLIAGYEGLMRCVGMIETADQVRLRESLERLVQLYDATERRAKADE
jgi:hypothetical protein